MKSAFKKPKNAADNYLISALLIFLFALILSYAAGLTLRYIRLTDAQSNVIADLISGVISAIAAGLVIAQLKDGDRQRKRQNDIEEAAFLLQYNQSFIQDPNMGEVEMLLEESAYYGRTEPIVTKDNRQKFINYLVYLEGLAPLVLNGVLSLDHIDDLMAYRFFLAINNSELQEKELKPFAADYRGCFKLYKEWSAYRKKEGYCIHLEESALDKWEHFAVYATR